MKKLIAFLLCFTILAVGITYGCIQYTLRTPAAEEIEEAGIDLNGFYDENDLVINEIREDGENVFISYPQIDGLKNAEVETAVNDEIRSEAERLKQQDIDAGGDLRYLSYNVSGSFGNTLSVGLYSAHEQVYLNFNLNDGTQLRLSDLFAQNADLQGMVHSAFYDALTCGHLGDRYWEKANSPDENKLYKTVKGYLSGEEQQFLFSPSGIYLYYDQYMATIPMADHAEDIVIYSKYLTEDSLFEQDGIGFDGMFTCADTPAGYERRTLGFGAENFWYDIAMSEAYMDERISVEMQRKFLSFYDDLYASMVAEVDVIRAAAEANPDKAYILLANPTAHIYSDSRETPTGWEIYVSNAAEVSANYMLYEMSIELFESKYRGALMEMYRTNTYTMFFGGLDEYIDGNEVLTTYRRSYELYDYETGEPITLENLFVEGYDYMDAVRRNKKYTLTSHYGYTLETAELALQGAWCEIGGIGLRVFLPEWGTEQYMSMTLSDFPRTALRIFE